MKSIKNLKNEVYTAYFDLDDKAYQERIRFFEDHEYEIYDLTFAESFDIQIDYCLALFSVKDYYQFNRRVDEMLNIIIEENIYSFRGIDIYKDLLFKKAESLMAIVDYYQAEHITSELVKLCKDNEAVKKLYLKNSIEKLRYESQKGRSITIGLFLLSGLTIAVEILYVRTFVTEWINIVVHLRNMLILSGFFNMLIQEIRIRRCSKKAYHKIRKSVLHKSPQI